MRTLLFGSVTALLLAPGLSLAPAAWSQIYKVTDDEKGVVFTDRPPTVSNAPQSTVERVELQDTNTAAPVAVRPKAPEATLTPQQEEAPAPSVQITTPANETTIAMGPGNFAVSATATPPLERHERLELLMDGQAIGAAQNSSSWFIEGALRGPHDLVVRRTTSRGKTVAVSDSVRVYVLRPSIIRR